MYLSNLSNWTRKNKKFEQQKSHIITTTYKGFIYIEKHLFLYYYR